MTWVKEVLDTMIEAQKDFGSGDLAVPMPKIDHTKFCFPKGGHYTISVPEGYSINTGKLFGSSDMPLDNMYLDPSGKWSPWTSEPTETPNTEVTCEHKWVDVGFLFTKLVCSECNAEKKEE